MACIIVSTFQVEVQLAILYKLKCFYIEFSLFSHLLGDGDAVLLRSLEPLENLEAMISLRTKFKKCPKRTLQKKDLCNGPAKLCMSFGIDIQSCNKQDLTSWDGMWIEEDEESSLVNKIVCSPRIGIKCEKEWQDKLLRFYILDNTHVSKLEKSKMNIILDYS